MKRVYIDMVGDLFHIGHLNIIKAAKKFGDYLIVGVHSDEDVSTYKRTPIISETSRYSIIRSCKYVDQVVENAPLKITKGFIQKYNIDIVVHGDDESPHFLSQHRVPIDLGIMKYIPYTQGISTTDIINTIKTR